MRIKEFPSVTTPSPDDVFVLDGSSGTRKISIDNLKTTLANSLGVGSGGANSSTDFVVSQGTSGGWSYRKWNNGIKECWLVKEDTASFNLIYPYPGLTNQGELIHGFHFTFPWGSSDGFSSPPVVLASGGTAGDMSSWVSYVGAGATEGDAYIKSHHTDKDVADKTTTRTYTLHIYAIGR